MPYSIVPPHHGGAVRLYNLIRRLSEHCHLYVFLFSQIGDDPAQRQALEAWTEEIFFHPWQPRLEPSPGDLRPPSARLFWDPRAALRLRGIVETQRIDVVQLEYTELAGYRHMFDATPVILVEHDVAFRSFNRRRRLNLPQRYPPSKIYGAGFRDWMRLLRHEVRACRDAAQLHMMSTEDASYLARFLPDGMARMRVVPNGVDTGWYRPPANAPLRRGVLFVGNFHTLPNLDAFEFLIGEVWPAIRRRRPDAELTVAGAQMPDDFQRWHGRDGIAVVGMVPELRDVYHRHQVLLVPLRAGSGTRLKLFEAFAAGIPAVSTTVGAEGIDAVDGEHLLIADGAENLAHAVDRLLADEPLAASIAENAMRLAAERYDWDASAKILLAGIHELMPADPPPRPEPRPLTSTVPRPFGSSPAGEIELSVLIPVFRGGEMLRRCLKALARQDCPQPFEVLCIDSGSPEDDLDALREAGARVYGIGQRFFNHGLTRDLAASLAAGKILIFLNQDAIPADEHWLKALIAPFLAADPPAAVQGSMRDFQAGEAPLRPFFWDTGGPRFYFTREMEQWMVRYPGPSFSTVSAAIRRDVWQALPFGWAPIMEDKKWQQAALDEGLQIVEAVDAVVFHSHDYTVRSLARRCQSEGFGWRLLGQRYSAADMLRDLLKPRLGLELIRGLWRRRGRLTLAELLFPWLRPLALWYGNRFLRDVKH